MVSPWGSQELTRSEDSSLCRGDLASLICEERFQQNRELKRATGSHREAGKYLRFNESRNCLHFAQYNEDWRNFENNDFIHIKQKELLKKKV